MQLNCSGSEILRDLLVDENTLVDMLIRRVESLV